MTDWLRYQGGMCFQLIYSMLKMRERKLRNWELGLSLLNLFLSFLCLSEMLRQSEVSAAQTGNSRLKIATLHSTQI